MGVNNLKVQLEFRMGGDGWSEQFYCSGSSPIGAKALGHELANKRSFALVKTARIHHVRISPANEQTVRSYRFPEANNAGAIDKLRDMGSATIVVGIFTETGHYRALKLHGCPDAAIAYYDDGSAKTTLTSEVKAFLDYLAPGVAGSPWQIKARAKTAADATNVAIVDITMSGTDVLLQCATAGFAAKDKITVSGCKGYNVRQFNKNWRVKAVVAGPPAGLLCTPAFQVSPGFFYVGASGVIRSNQGAGFSYLPMFSHDDFMTFSERKTGRPTDEHRGRVSSRR